MTILTRLYVYNTTSIILNSKTPTYTNVYPSYNGNNWIVNLSTDAPDGQNDGALLLNALTKLNYFTDDKIGVDIIQFSTGKNLDTSNYLVVTACIGAQNSINVYIGTNLVATLSAGQSYNTSSGHPISSSELKLDARSNTYTGYVTVSFQTYNTVGGGDLGDSNLSTIYFIPRPCIYVSNVTTDSFTGVTPTLISGVYKYNTIDNNNQQLNAFTFSKDDIVTNGGKQFKISFLNGILDFNFATIYNNPLYSGYHNNNIVHYIKSYCIGDVTSYINFWGYDPNETTYYLPSRSSISIEYGTVEIIIATLNNLNIGIFKQTINYIINNNLDRFNDNILALELNSTISSQIITGTAKHNYDIHTSQTVVNNSSITLGTITWNIMGGIRMSGIFKLSGNSPINLSTDNTLGSLFSTVTSIVIVNSSGSNIVINYYKLTSTLTRDDTGTITLLDGNSLVMSQIYFWQSSDSNPVWSSSPQVATGTT